MSGHLSVTATAPGKLFLLGEYAVLHGAPAIVAAIDSRARVRTALSEDSGWRLTAPGIGVSDLALGADGALPDGVAPGTRRALAVFDAARAVIAAEIALPPLRVGIDTAGFAADGAKLGIGASAAVTVALIGAFARAAGVRLSRAAVLERAIRAHRRAQNGEGSGADVAAAALGGLLVYGVERPPRPLAWPEGLHAFAVRTGRGADTRALVGATRRLAEGHPGRHRDCIEALAARARRGAEALENSDVGGVLAAADAYFDGLADLGEAAGAGIVTDTHHRLRRLAASAGGVFKPTGAGGGDLGIVLTGSGAARKRCAAAFDEAGHAPAALRFGTAGLRVAPAQVR